MDIMGRHLDTQRSPLYDKYLLEFGPLSRVQQDVMWAAWKAWKSFGFIDHGSAPHTRADNRPLVDNSSLFCSENFRAEIFFVNLSNDHFNLFKTLISPAKQIKLKLRAAGLQALWPDFAKFYHCDQILNVFWKLLQDFQPTMEFVNANRQFSICRNIPIFHVLAFT